ncbi:MAG TPA: hypothetical protein VF746_07995 [Longimicrobium sp.]|jgi:hypothetical protein
MKATPFRRAARLLLAAAALAACDSGSKSGTQPPPEPINPGTPLRLRYNLYRVYYPCSGRECDPTAAKPFIVNDHDALARNVWKNTPGCNVDVQRMGADFATYGVRDLRSSSNPTYRITRIIVALSNRSDLADQSLELQALYYNNQPQIFSPPGPNHVWLVRGPVLYKIRPGVSDDQVQEVAGVTLAQAHAVFINGRILEMSSTKPTVLGHEFGHLMELTHVNEEGNLMADPNFFTGNVLRPDQCSFARQQGPVLGTAIP